VNRVWNMSSWDIMPKLCEPKITFGDLRFQGIVFVCLQVFLVLCNIIWFMIFVTSMFWAWIPTCCKWIAFYGLDVVYHLMYFYVMCCICDDIDGCKGMILKTNVGRLLVFKIIIKSTFNFFPFLNGWVFRSFKFKEYFWKLESISLGAKFNFSNSRFSSL
jgi:hypothetical protein